MKTDLGHRQIHLTKEGYEVYTAYDGEEALEKKKWQKLNRI